MADILIDAGVHSITYRVQLRGGIFWKSPTVGYAIYANTDYDLEYNKTADGGATWAGAVSIKAGLMAAIDCWADWQTDGDAGTKIHIAYIDTDTDDVRYIYLDTATDTVGGDDQIEACQGTGALLISLFRVDQTISITKTRGGNLAVGFRYKDSDSVVFDEFYTSPDATTWTSKTSPWEAATDTLLLFPANLADNDDLWALYFDDSANAISLKTFDDSGNSWSENAIATMAYSLEYIQMDGQVRLSDGHLIVAFWNEGDTATADLEVWDITDGGTITQKTNVITDEAETICVSVFINQVNDDIYVTYFSGTAWASLVAAFYQKSTDGGGTWGGEAALQADAEDDMRWISAGCMKAAWGGKFLPFWFDDDDDDLFANTDNGVSIAAAVAVVDGTAAGSGVGLAESFSLLTVLASALGNGIGLSSSSSYLEVLATASGQGIGLATAQAILDVLAAPAGSGIGLGTTQALIHVLAAAAASGEGLGEAEALLEVIAEAAGEGIGSGLVLSLIEIIEGTGAGSGIGIASAVAILSVLAEATGHGIGESSTPGIIRLVLNIKRRPEIHNLGKVKSTPHNLGESLDKYTLGGKVK